LHGIRSLVQAAVGHPWFCSMNDLDMMRLLWRQLNVTVPLLTLPVSNVVRGFLYCGGRPLSPQSLAQSFSCMDVVPALQSMPAKNILSTIDAATRVGMLLKDSNYVALPEWGDGSVGILSAGDHRIKIALLWMHMNLGDWFSMGQLAKVAGISQSRVHHLFQAQLETSPLQYVKRIRMSAARALLQNTGLSVKEILAAAGISDASHFCQEFKARHGKCPSSFRKACHHGISGSAGFPGCKVMNRPRPE
jgi:AraC-like DNA-binding protein